MSTNPIKSSTLPASMRYGVPTSADVSVSAASCDDAVTIHSFGSLDMEDRKAQSKSGATVQSTVQQNVVDHQDPSGSSDYDENFSATRSNDSVCENHELVAEGAIKPKLLAQNQEHINQKIAELHRKIENAKDQLKSEQMSRDENVDKYLKLAANMNASPDNPQILRIRQVFEKRNNKTAQNIHNLQKKLENYEKRLQQLSSCAVTLDTQPLHASAAAPTFTSRKSKDKLKDVGQNLKEMGINVKESITGYTGGFVDNIKGGLTGIGIASQTAAGTVMSVPRLLFKTKSCDNIHQASDKVNHGAPSIPRLTTQKVSGNSTFPAEASKEHRPSFDLSGSSGPAASPRHVAVAKFLQREAEGVGSESGSGKGVSDLDFQSLLEELTELREYQKVTQETIDSIKFQVQEEYRHFNQLVYELKFRQQRLEDQINDITELQQAEVANLKQELLNMEEKIEYRERERLREVTDMLESCIARVTKVEHNQNNQLSSSTGFDGLQPTANTFVLKGIHLLIILLQFVLVVVATTAEVVVPFIRTRIRAVVSVSCAVAIYIVYHYRSDLTQLSENIFRRK